MTYQCPEVVPDLRYVRIQADSPRVCIQGIAILVDLVVQNSDRAPECRVATIAIHSLLIRFIGLGELLLCHIAAAEQVPTLGILVVCGKDE